jgi:phosphoribosylglycinamide formyltransferase-1
MTAASETRLPVVALVSGRGSNLRAIVEQMRANALPIEIRAVISDRADCAAISWARAEGFDTHVLRPVDYPDRAAYDQALAAAVARYDPALVVLAGFMRILGPEFVNVFLGRTLNIHPSLLPRHRGLDTHRRVLAAGDRQHGASVHFVTLELDGGPVVLQARVPVLPGDDEVRLAARVLEQEHVIYSKCIQWFAIGRLQYRAGGAWLDGRLLDAPVMLADAVAPGSREANT